MAPPRRCSQKASKPEKRSFVAHERETPTNAITMMMLLRTTTTSSPSRNTARRLTTTCVIKPPSHGKVGKNSPRDEVFKGKTARAPSALAILELEGAPELGLYGRPASALEQASSVTAAYRALEQDDYDESSESAPGLWKRLSGKIRDEYLM